MGAGAKDVFCGKEEVAKDSITWLTKEEGAPVPVTEICSFPSEWPSEAAKERVDPKSRKRHPDISLMRTSPTVVWASVEARIFLG